jgi:hypothetical protein
MAKISADNVLIAMIAEFDVQQHGEFVVQRAQC